MFAIEEEGVMKKSKKDLEKSNFLKGPWDVHFVGRKF